MKLTPQQEKIIECLRDRDWHCFASKDFYMKDDRTRIAELNKEGSYLHERGYWINSRKCDGRCNVSHSSRIVMRRAEKIVDISKPNSNKRAEYVAFAAHLVKEFDASTEVVV